MFKNLFASDILVTYAVAHRNSAMYFLKNKFPEDAYREIQAAIKLEKDDPKEENNRLLSIYYVMKENCKKAENTINKAIDSTVNQTNLKQLKYVADNCYKDEKNKKRIYEKLNNYIKNKNTPISNF